MNGFQDDLVFYLNVVLDSQGTMYSRQHYTLIDVLEQQGGITQCFLTLAIILMFPFTFKRHELSVVFNYERDNCEDYLFKHS